LRGKPERRRRRRHRTTRGQPPGALSAQLRSAVQRAAITAADRRQVFGPATSRIVPSLQKPAFGVGAHLRLVRTGSEVCVEAGARNRWQSISVGPSAAGASFWAVAKVGARGRRAPAHGRVTARARSETARGYRSRLPCCPRKGGRLSSRFRVFRKEVFPPAGRRYIDVDHSRTRRGGVDVSAVFLRSFRASGDPFAGGGAGTWSG
jgi:hypothetical protein